MTDVLLKTLIVAANEAGFGFDISLIVPGGIVTGTVITADEYLKRFADTFANAWPGGPSEEIRESFANIGSNVEGYNQNAEDYIHLADAAYVSTSGFLPDGGKGMLWRGKIDSVSGYSFGRFQK